MILCSITNFYIGLKIIQNNQPCIILSNEFIKPGKGKAFNRVKLRNLISNKIIEKIFKSNDYVKVADIININSIYLYNDSKFWYFIDEKKFEQLAVTAAVIGKNNKWLLTNKNYILTLWNNRPIIITPPKFVELKIINTEPYIKHFTINNSKFATTTNGITVKVPLFIKSGDIIKIDTRSGEYISRINN